MVHITKEEIREALNAILEERQKAVEALQLTDPRDRTKPFLFPALPKAATSDEIQRLEEMLGQRLPPSYRHFLQMYNGLPKFDIGSNLLSVDEVIKMNIYSPPQELERMLQMIERDSTEGLIIFGATQSGHPRFMFDSKKQDPDGEWAVIEYGEEEELYDEYANLLEFFIDVVETIRLTGDL